MSEQGMDTPFDIAMGALNVGIWTAIALGKDRWDFAAIAAFFLVGTVVCCLRVSSRLQP